MRLSGPLSDKLGVSLYDFAADPERAFRVAEVVGALSRALDLGAGSASWHSARTCILGMRIAQEVRLPQRMQQDLYYALWLKDAGCSSNASEIFHSLRSDDIRAKGDVKKIDWTRTTPETVGYAFAHVAPDRPIWERIKIMAEVALHQQESNRRVTAARCERGATLARLMGLPEGTANAIGGLDEHWNGKGFPHNLKREEIPLTSRIMLLAQTLDVFLTDGGPDKALSIAKQRSGTWFDPALVRAVQSLSRNQTLWSGLCEGHDFGIAMDLEPICKTMTAGDATLDRICQAFAQIVDAKSPFTQNHSNGVANASVAIAQQLGFDTARLMLVRHAALLHDLGKMAVSNTILEKPGKLNDDEWAAMRSHPEHTLAILRDIRGFEELSEVAASHHEKLDGTGYFRGLTASQLSTEARILVVADIFDALTADRPYRAGMPLERVHEILRSDAPHKLDGDCVEALIQSGKTCDQTFRDLQALDQHLTKSAATTLPTVAEPRL